MELALSAHPQTQPGSTGASTVLSILIVNWNTREDLLRCLNSLFLDTIGPAFEVIVVDNASSDGSVEAVTVHFPDVRVIASPTNLGFARANNQAAAHALGESWLLLNPDTIVQTGAVRRLFDYLVAQPDVAAVGPRLLNPDGTLQPSIERLPTLFTEWWRLLQLDAILPISQYPQRVLASTHPQAVEVLNGACLLLRREAVEALGLFDDDYFVYSEEVDLCDRLRSAGWALHWVPEAVVIHYGGHSTQQVANQMFLELYRNKLTFFRKRRGPFAGRLYKLILLQAALPRFIFGCILGHAPLARSSKWRRLSQQYWLLLASLLKW
jgi:GT2 family glycosyltransferase